MVPSNTSPAPSNINGVSRSLRKKKPQTTPKSGTINVTDAAKAALTFFDQTKIEDVRERRAEHADTQHAQPS
jgi:hypothetical protein